ncbi:MAG: CoA-binding protein [Caldilineaceae bacterium]
MNIKDQAAAFLAQKRIAVVGVSRKQGTGNGIFTSLRARGYEVFPVNPNATEVMGESCYPSVKAIPGGSEGGRGRSLF